MLAGLMVATLAGCDRQGVSKEPVTLTGRTMGTTYSIKLIPSDRNFNQEAIRTKIDDRLKLVNMRMSTYIPNSEISRFNRYTKSDWFPVSPETAQVVKAALDIAKQSDGAFDVTVNSLIELWGFGTKKRENGVPEQATIVALLQSINYQKLHIRENPAALKKDNPDVTVTLSAIAKGYGVDAVATLLENNGIDSYMVEIGGEIRVRGFKEEKQPWVIAIERPTQGNRSIQQLIALTDKGMATSGDYRNYFEKEGKRYSHMLNPQTGYPITHNLASVTVVADTSMAADAWATTLSVMGMETAYPLARQLNMAVFFIVRSGAGFEIKMTPAFEKFLISTK